MGGLEGPPKPPDARKRPGIAGALLDLALGFAGASKGPPVQTAYARGANGAYTPAS